MKLATALTIAALILTTLVVGLAWLHEPQYPFQRGTISAAPTGEGK